MRRKTVSAAAKDKIWEGRKLMRGWNLGKAKPRAEDIPAPPRHDQVIETFNSAVANLSELATVSLSASYAGLLLIERSRHRRSLREHSELKLYETRSPTCHRDHDTPSSAPLSRCSNDVRGIYLCCKTLHNPCMHLGLSAVHMAVSEAITVRIDGVQGATGRVKR